MSAFVLLGVLEWNTLSPETVRVVNGPGGEPLLDISIRGVALMVLALAIAKPVGSEAILICSISPGVICPMLAVRYKVYEAQAASTFLLATLLMIVVLPIAIVLTK